MAPQRDWFEQDFYRVLGVAEDASAKEITKAYRKLARESHPDKHPGDAAAEERFKEISAAYDVIGDETRRAEYDEVRRMGPVGAGRSGFTFNADDFAGSGGLGDLFGNLFGRGRGGAGSAAGVGPRRGADIEADLDVDFVDAARGMTTTLHLTTDASCSTCHGTGARPGTSPHVCGRCNGRGVVDDNQGMFSFSSPCPVCRGAGTVVDDPCPTCHGSGIEKRPRQVATRIPPGVKDGQTIRLKGRGGPGRNGGPAGDLLVRLRVAPHPVFGRTGDHLTVTVPITFAEAALGADVDVPTLDGGPVTLRVKPGTQSGSRHRVTGRGIQNGKRTGDLIVTTEVRVPTKLSDEERQAIEQLASVATEHPRGGRS
jgi:molecular chaperone DnaJ